MKPHYKMKRSRFLKKGDTFRWLDMDVVAMEVQPGRRIFVKFWGLGINLQAGWNFDEFLPDSYQFVRIR